MKRRIMYLHTITQRSETEITKQLVLAQKADSKKGEFYWQVQQDMDHISLAFEEITKISEEKLRVILSKKIKEHAFDYLMSKARCHSKVNDAIYTNCEGCDHYKDPRFTPDIINLLFRFRTRTYLVKNNFRNNYKNNNILCPLCHQQNDDQHHLLNCIKIKEVYGKDFDFNMEDIFSLDMDKLYNVGNTLKKVNQIRNELLNSDGKNDMIMYLIRNIDWQHKLQRIITVKEI